jgi:predicted dehydrogenase
MDILRKDSMKTLRIGCFGINGHTLFSGADQLNRAAITAISGVTDEQYEKLRRDFSGVVERAKRFPNLETMLEDDSIDLVALCSPRRDEQAGHTVSALLAGRHVYAEKPLALVLEDLEHIRTVACQTGREVRVCTGSSYDPTHCAMREVVRSGEIGEVVQVFAQKSYPYHDNRPQDRGRDGGLILQAGIHAVCFTRWVTGREFVTVSAFETKLGNPTAGDLRMAASLCFELDNGAVGVANFNYLQPRTDPYWGNDQLRVHGIRGMVETVDGYTRRSVTTSDRKRRALRVSSQPSFFQEYIDLLLDGTPMRVCTEDTLRETEVVIRMQEAATTGCRVVIPIVECGMQNAHIT